MRTPLRCLPLVVAVLVSACEHPTAPGDSARLSAGRAPNASISDGAHSGVAGFYFLPSLVSDPGPFTGTFDAALQPYATICPIAGCGDLGPIMAFPFGGTQPTGIAVNVLTESYNANWSKPTLDVGQYRLSVKVAVPLPQGTSEVQLGFVDLQVISKKKDPVDAGFVSVVKGSPIPVKVRIETGIIGGVVIGLPGLGLAHFYPGDLMQIYASVYNLHGEAVGASCVTWSSSTGAVTVTPSSKGALLTAISPGESLISATCGAVSGAVLVSVEAPPA